MKESEIVAETIKKYKERLESARILYKADKYNDSVSRSYYALFDAIRGLLEVSGESAKSHRGLLVKFHNNFIKTGKVSKRYSKTIGRMAKLREEADYSFTFDITKIEAKAALSDVEELLTKIEKVLKAGANK
jgi:hypothetical protein